VQPKLVSSLTGASALLSAFNIWSSEPAQAPEQVAETTPEAGASEQVAPAAPVQCAPSQSAPSQPAADATPRAADSKRVAELRENTANPVHPRAWPPRKLSLALQGGGSFGAFTWGALDRLLEEPGIEFDAMSGASVGAVNAALVACGLIVDGREGARKLLARFWNRVTKEASFRSLMLVGGFSPAGSSMAFGQTLQSGRFDPFDLDPLRRAL